MDRLQVDEWHVTDDRDIVEDAARWRQIVLRFRVTQLVDEPQDYRDKDQEFCRKFCRKFCQILGKNF